MLNSNRTTVGIFLFCVLLGVLFLVVPKYAHAELTSSQYTLSAYGFGHGNTTLSSPNFTLTPSNNTQASLSTFVTPLPTPTPGNSGGSSGRSRLVLETIRTSTSTGIGTDVARVLIAQNTANTPRASGAENVGEVEDIEDTSSALEVVNTIGASEEDSLNLVASLIGARDAFNEIFKEKSARIALFFGVVLFLWLVRTYTVIGRKYSPF